MTTISRFSWIKKNNSHFWELIYVVRLRSIIADDCDSIQLNSEEEEENVNQDIFDSDQKFEFTMSGEVW